MPHAWTREAECRLDMPKYVQSHLGIGRVVAVRQNIPGEKFTLSSSRLLSYVNRVLSTTNSFDPLTPIANLHNRT